MHDNEVNVNAAPVASEVNRSELVQTQSGTNTNILQKANEHKSIGTKMVYSKEQLAVGTKNEQK